MDDEEVELGPEDTLEDLFGSADTGALPGSVAAGALSGSVAAGAAEKETG